MQFFEFVAPESPHNNVNSLRACQLLLEARALSPAELQEAGIVDKVPAAARIALPKNAS
jgi:enoyl-CoA hydratase/carnithine racemase